MSLLLEVSSSTNGRRCVSTRLFTSTHKAFPEDEVTQYPTGSIAVTDEHGLHKRRRAMVQPYFTTRAVTGYEPMITDRVQTLCQMLEAKKGTIVRLDHALTALAMDVITAITFEKPTHCLMDDDFRPEL